jgi:large subunit ribosomal protein L4
MIIDIFSSTGSKVKTMELPASLFGADVNWGLMHQMVTLQQANRRQSPAHVKTRAEVSGSTRKIVAQKHTGGARHGNIRNPLMRGGGKNFGPRNDKNYTKDMPQKMRQAALRSALTVQAGKGVILGLEGYPESIKTKAMSDLLKKLPVDLGRRIVFVMPAAHKQLQLSARNIEGVKTITANYLNLEDILNARHIIFVADAIEKADAIFGKKEKGDAPVREKKEKKAVAKKAAKKTTAKKPSTKKAS